MLEQVLTGRWSAADLQRWCDDGSPPPLASSDGRWAAWDAATLGEWAAHDWPGAVEAVERATNPTPGGLDWTAWARLRREPDLRDDQRLDLWLVGQLPGYRPRCPGFAPSAEALTPGSWARLDGASFMAFLGSRFAALLGGLAPASELGRAVTRSHARQAILRSAGMSEGAPLIAPLLVASDQAICQAARERCGETLEAPAALLELARRILDPTPEDLLTPAELRAFRGLEALRGRGIPFDEVRAADLLRQHPALCAGLRWKAEGRRLELVVPTEGAARDLLSRPVDSVAEAILILSLVPGVATTHEAEAEASWQASLVALDGVVARAREEATRAAAVAAATEVAYINLLSTASRRRGTGLA